jgi:hypothetical protein
MSGGVFYLVSDTYIREEGLREAKAEEESSTG